MSGSHFKNEKRCKEHSYNFACPLSSRQMESLVALCDTLLPSIKVSKDHVDGSLVKLYQTSASMTGTPNQVNF